MAVRRSLLNPQAPEYIPISHLPNTPFHPPSLRPMPYHYSAPPLPPPPPALLPQPLPSPLPFPTVYSSPRENFQRSSVNTRVPRNIPLRVVKARENSRPRTPPRMRSNVDVPRQRGRSGFSSGNKGGFGRKSCSNEGFVCQRRGVCYGKYWVEHNELKKHDVIPLSWTQKNTTTTVMIKNIPYDYKREMLMQFLDEYCLVENQKATDSKGQHVVSAYDFLYLPMDFKSKSGKGYAFVNFTDHRTVLKFFCVFNDKINVFPRSYRTVKIVTAKIQGKESLVKRFKETRFQCESEGFLPVWFSPPRNGSGESVQMITVGKCKPAPSCSYFLDK